VGTLLLELVPFALGLAITPAAIAFGVLLLAGPRPLAHATAFGSAFAMVYTGLSVLVLGIAGASNQHVDPDTKHVVSAWVGGFMLALAVISEVRHRARGPVRRPGMLERLHEVSLIEVFGLGVALAVVNPNVAILLGGLAAIAAANASVADQVVGTAFLVLFSVSGIAIPAIWYAADAESARRQLARLDRWLLRHQHAVNETVLVGFGAIFLLKGVLS
jgi:hypothetical protein